MNTDVPVVVDTDDMSLAEKERLAAVAKSMTDDLLAATDLLGGVAWKLVQEKHGVSLFRAETATDAPCNVHAVYKFFSDIEDVAESMITSTTDSYKNMMSMLSSDFIDGAVVQTIVEPSEVNPHRHVALKWAAFKSSSRFGKDRDFIILEYVDMIEDDQGQKIAFRIMESVDVPNNSLYAESTKYSRDIVPLMGFMYHTTKKPGELRLTYSCNFDKNGDLPAWAANSAIQQHVEKCIHGIVKYIENFRHHNQEIVLPQQAIPMSEQDHCRVCEKNFCVLRRKYHCLKCGAGICSSCSSLRTAKVPDVGERQLRVCTACVIAVRRSSKTPAPQEGGLLLGGASRAPSTATVDSDVTSVRSGSSGTSTVTMGSRTQSFSTAKRRSLDDMLDPVRSRLIEYKTFSDATEVIPIPKASFPVRSFSDGIIKGSIFTSKRRGSPADLAMSIEAFREYQNRRGNNDQQQDQEQDQDQEDGISASESDEEAMEQLQYFSTSPGSSTSSATSSAGSGEPVVPLSEVEMRRQRPRSGGATRKKTITVDYDSYSLPYHTSTKRDETRARFHEAKEKVEGLIEATQMTHNLAQHVRRKASHHRVAALQAEDDYVLGHQPPMDAVPPECNVGIIPPARVRRAVCQTKNGAVLYGQAPSSSSSSSSIEITMDHQIQLLAKGIADIPTSSSNQRVDTNYRRQHGAVRYR